MNRWVLIVCACFAACGAKAGEVADEALRYWTEQVGICPFEEVLLVFAQGPTMEWPAVHSAEYQAEREIAERDASYRNLEAHLLGGLQAFEVKLRDAPETDFLSRADMLLDMRDRFALHPAYANLLFVDAIESCLVADIGARLANQSGVSAEMLALLARLENGHPTLDAFWEMVCGELPGEYAVGDAWQEDGDSGGQKSLATLWNVLMPGIPIGWPGPETRFDLETVLRTRSLDGMLFRFVSLDTFIRSLLPSMARYRHAAPEAPPRATYADFKAVMGRESLAPVSLGTRPWGMERAAAAANELVSSVDSGKIWARIAFSASQVQNGREYRHSNGSGNTN